MTYVILISNQINLLSSILSSKCYGDCNGKVSLSNTRSFSIYSRQDYISVWRKEPSRLDVFGKAVCGVCSLEPTERPVCQSGSVPVQMLHRYLQLVRLRISNLFNVKSFTSMKVQRSSENHVNIHKILNIFLKLITLSKNHYKNKMCISLKLKRICNMVVSKVPS